MLPLYKQPKKKITPYIVIYENVNLIFNKNTNKHNNMQLNRLYSLEGKTIKNSHNSGLFSWMMSENR